MQRGFLTVVSPIQDGANKALKPVRDLFGWFGNTLHAKSQHTELAQADRQTAPGTGGQPGQRSTYDELLKLYHLDHSASAATARSTATVIVQSPNIWYSTVEIDHGTSSGVRVNDPVIDDEGLIGKVARWPPRRPGDLITDSSMGVSARIGTSNTPASSSPRSANPNDLLMQYLPATPGNAGEYVVTSGTSPAPTNRSPRRGS